MTIRRRKIEIPMKYKLIMSNGVSKMLPIGEQSLAGGVSMLAAFGAAAILERISLMRIDTHLRRCGNMTCNIERACGISRSVVQI